MTNRESCLDSARHWRAEAENLRDLAQAPHLKPAGREALLHQSEAADRQAEWWEAGAREEP